MQVFKAALKVFLKHKAYIMVYMVALSFMAIFIGLSVAGTQEDEFATERPNIAIIDRDGSELSKGISGFLGDHAEQLELEDSRRAMQDAIAQDRADYIVIIPEGFGGDFVSYALNGSTAPVLETVVRVESISASMMSNLANEYLNTLRLFLSSGTAQAQGEAIALTNSVMEHEAAATMVFFGESAPPSQQWVLFMQFSSYTIMLTIIVCVGVLLAAFNKTEVRRRNLSSPINTLSMNLQLAAACVVVALIAWTWVSLVGLAVFGQSLVGVDFRIIGLGLLALLAFCSVALSIGFLFGQLTTSEIVLNAAGNITGLALSFLGGVWVAIDFLGESVVAIARFIPSFYYNSALLAASNLHEFTGSSITPILMDVGIVLLFAAAIFAIALAAGRLKVQSAEAGGNAAAAAR